VNTPIILEPNFVSDRIKITTLWDKAVSFKDIADTPIEFLVQGLVTKGESTMLTGDFASFKTFMSYFVADAISEGKLFAGRATEQHPVLILDRENSKGTVSRRRYLVGNLRDTESVKILGRFTTPQAPDLANAELLQTCRTMHPFIIIDSMQDFHVGKSENNPDDMTEFFQAVNALIDAGAIGVLILHHVPKSGAGKGKMYRGSTGIPGGVTGGALYVEKIGATGVKLTGFKTRDGEDAAIELELEFPSEATTKDKTGRVTYKLIQSGMTSLEQIDAAILEQVRIDNKAGKHPSANQVVKQIGCHRNTGLDRVKVLVDEAKLSRDNIGLFFPEPGMFQSTTIN
jgi:hypothetical protein